MKIIIWHKITIFIGADSEHTYLLIVGGDELAVFGPAIHGEDIETPLAISPRQNGYIPVHTKNETKSWDGKRLARSMQITKCFVFRRQTSEAKQKQIQTAGPPEPAANNLLRLLSFLYSY